MRPGENIIYRTGEIKMKNIFSDDNTKEDLEAIKMDIENLVHRLSNLKEHSIEALNEQIDSLSSAIGSLKEKGIEIGRDNAAIIYSTTRKHPLRMLLCAFGIGILTSYLIKKK